MDIPLVFDVTAKPKWRRCAPPNLIKGISYPRAFVVEKIVQCFNDSVSLLIERIKKFLASDRQ